MRRRDWLLLWARALGYSFIGSACATPPTRTFGSLPDVGVDDEATALPPDKLFGTYEVRSDSAIAWVSSTTACRANLELWKSGESGARHIDDISIDEEAGLVGAFPLTGLEPNREYRFRAWFDDSGFGPWLGFRTAPRPDYLAPLSILFSADIGYNSELFDIFEGVPAADFYLSLGDWPYADKFPAARSIAEFRERHRLSRSAFEIQEFMWRMPIAAIYDDHDIVNGWTRELSHTDPARLEAGLQAWRESFPLMSRTQYRDFRWGALAHFFILDTRLYRDDPYNSDAETRTMLGAEQVEWLMSGLATTDATFKFVASSVPFEFDDLRESDSWGAFTAERRKLRTFIAEMGIENVLLLTGDRHWFACRHLEDGLREYQVGPMAAGLGMYPDEFPPEVMASARTRNYGKITIVESRPGVWLMTFQCMSSTHEVIYEEAVEAFREKVPRQA